MALVIPRTKTIDLGGGQTGVRETLLVDMTKQTAADVHEWIVNTTTEQTTIQINLKNPPQLLEVDGLSNRPLDQVQKRTMTLFGTVLAAAAMRLIETALEAAIRQSTISRSGALADVVGHWGWIFVSGGVATRVSSGSPPASFGVTDRLILQPIGVPYATNVNQAVRHDAAILKRTRRKKSEGGGKRLSAIGFLEAAVSSVKRRREFAAFSIYAAFTKSHKVAGEFSRVQGSPMIVVRPRLRAGRI